MVTTRICGRLGCTSPVFGFSWWEPDVAIAVSRAGGVGVWGCTRRTPDEIEMGLTRMKDELGDLPWGVDLVIPSGMPDTDDRAAIEAELPEEHVAFVASLREKYGVPDDGLPGYRSRFVRSEETAREQLDVVMDHRIPLLALGIGSPAWAVEQAHERGSLIVSLVGRPAHAESAIRAGADVLVAQGTDAGGHTGPIGTFSLVPQVVDIAGGRPVLAAGGVATGRHLAAALALGADGVWMGTAFLGSVTEGLGPEGRWLHLGLTTQDVWDTATSLQLILVITLLSLAPGLAIMVTCFPFIVTVLAILRQGLGLQQSPPNMLIVSLALFLTYFVMEPVFQEAYSAGIEPLMNNTLATSEAIEAGLQPFRIFMAGRVDPDTFAAIADLRPDTVGATVGDDAAYSVLVPSFMLSEIARAFQVGFLVFLPFLIIDLVVAAILMSMGMMMVPPAIVSLPFKLAFFVVADGWSLLAGSLVRSYF